MATSSSTVDIAASIATFLPYLRRYARALTGSQARGDAYAAATLEAILKDRTRFDSQLPAKIALYKALQAIWKGTDLDVMQVLPEGLEKTAQKHLARLTPDSREALLLSTIEGFRAEEVAQIMSLSQDQIVTLLDVAHREMDAATAGRILIIEDEAIIAMDIESLVTEMGHAVIGVARTHEGATKMGHADRPDLILADIQLADNSSGIDAVNELLAEFGRIPTVFITAFPERLLTGERPEPAFLITKPYGEDQVRSAVAQAMFFASTETLKS